MVKKMTFLRFVAWYFGSFLVSLGLLAGLLAIWSYRWHRAHEAEIRENATYWAYQTALEDVWRYDPSFPVSTVPSAKKTQSHERATVSENIRQARHFSKCGTISCTYDIRSYTKIH
ncbi:MAG TPA: hypothetical protein VIE65_04235 [Methylobacter sp.]|jgi:hypothetical protein